MYSIVMYSSGSLCLHWIHINTCHKWSYKNDHQIIFLLPKKITPFFKKNGHQITFLLMESESRKGEKWMINHHPSNSKPIKVKVSPTLLHYIILYYPSPFTSYHAHLSSLIIFPWSSFSDDFLYIQFQCIRKQINRL